MRIVLICTECGCRSFYHYANGDIECANCDAYIHVDGEDEAMTAWRRSAPPTPEDVSTIPEEDHSNLSAKVMGAMAFARRAVLTKANKWGDDVIALFVINKEGDGSHWSGAETAEQRDWITKRMKSVIEHMDKAEYPE